MVKNWADHCSSDEEEVDLDEPVAVVDPDVLKKEIESENKAFHDGPDDDEEEEAAIEAAAAATAAAPAKKTFEFPAEAPFTAYVGNLSYNIMDPQELAEKLTTLAKDLLELDLKIVDSRIMMDRRNPSPKPRHRGFAYVQVETLDMLKKLMELNDKEATLEGRQLVLDTSTTNNNRRNSNRNNNNSNDANNTLPDGSQFRGGRFGNNNNNNRRPSSSQQQRRSYTDQKDDGGVPPQRTSLKLAPRTKPIEESSGSQSNIFGGAKARDEQAWQERRKSANEGSSGGDGGGRGRGGGRGGRGGRGGGRHNNEGGGRSQRGSFKDRKDRKSFKDNKGGGGAAAAAAPAAAAAAGPPAEEQPAAPPPASPAKPAEKTAEKKVVNKFAALDFSDDSD